MTDFKVENVVISIHLKESLDLQDLSVSIPESKYDSNETPAVILDIIEPRASIMFLSSGKIIITGLKNIDDIEIAISNLAKKIKPAGLELPENPEKTIENMTISKNLCQKLNLKSISNSLPKAEYNPTKFSGIVYKTNDPNTVILLFDSGKIVCNGKDPEKIKNSIEEMANTLSSLGML